MYTLHLIRHGQASFGADDYDRLSALGIRQMTFLAEFLAATGCRAKAVYTGPLRRQRASADEVVRRCRELHWEMPSPVVLPALSEYDYQAVLDAQVPDMLAADPSLEKDLADIYDSNSAFQRVFEQAMLRWVSGRHDTPGVETWSAFTDRVERALDEIAAAHEDGHILVFTSGGVITTVLQTVLEITAGQSLKLGWQLVNASLTRFAGRTGRLTLTGFNLAAHLELQRDRTLITYR